MLIRGKKITKGRLVCIVLGRKGCLKKKEDYSSQQATGQWGEVEKIISDCPGKFGAVGFRTKECTSPWQCP